jgi:hypothetical protein
MGADMTQTGIDVAWDRPTVTQIKALGAHWVARYFSNDDAKDLHRSEVLSYTVAGLAIVTVFETTAGRATAGRAAGAADARNAEAQREAVGLPDNHVQHFAVDKDVSWAAVAPYFAGVSSVIDQDRVGVYGGIDVITGAYQAGYRYLWQTVAWSEGRWHPHATIRQTGGTTLSGGADWDTAMVPDFGQHPRPVQEDDVELSDKYTAKKGAWTKKDQTASIGDWIALGNLKAEAAQEAAAQALAQARANGSGLSALSAKLDKLTAAAPTIDYAKLAAALIAAVKES